MKSTLDTPLGEVRDELRAELMAGEAVCCPACTQLAKIYKRTIHATMARVLILMHRHGGDAEGWIQVPTLLTEHKIRLGDESKLACWDLIERFEGVREDGSKNVGIWRVTDKGRAFVRAEIVLPKYAHLYDGRVLGHSGDFVSIGDCLGDRFDYAELMGR